MPLTQPCADAPPRWMRPQLSIASAVGLKKRTGGGRHPHPWRCEDPNPRDTSIYNTYFGAYSTEILPTLFGLFGSPGQVRLAVRSRSWFARHVMGVRNQSVP